MTDDALGNSEQQVLPDLGEAREQLSSERPLAGLGGVTVSPEAIRLLPVDFVKLHCILPFGLRNGAIHIATAATSTRPNSSAASARTADIPAMPPIKK